MDLDKTQGEALGRAYLDHIGEQKTDPLHAIDLAQSSYVRIKEDLSDGVLRELNRLVRLGLSDSKVPVGQRGTVAGAKKWWQVKAD